VSPELNNAGGSIEKSRDHHGGSRYRLYFNATAEWLLLKCLSDACAAGSFARAIDDGCL
jgi:hypothetical protein